MRHILILNDGTDEIYNLCGISCKDLDDFIKQFKDLFRELNFEDHFYLEVQTEDLLIAYIDISHNNGITSYDMQLLKALAETFITWKEINIRNIIEPDCIDLAKSIINH